MTFHRNAFHWVPLRNEIGFPWQSIPGCTRRCCLSAFMLPKTVPVWKHFGTVVCKQHWPVPCHDCFLSSCQVSSLFCDCELSSIEPNWEKSVFLNIPNVETFKLPIRDLFSSSDMSNRYNLLWCYFIWDRAAPLMSSIHWCWALCILPFQSRTGRVLCVR